MENNSLTDESKVKLISDNNDMDEIDQEPVRNDSIKQQHTEDMYPLILKNNQV